jgi:hyperosmotically inducible periplasmic protein
MRIPVLVVMLAAFAAPSCKPKPEQRAADNTAENSRDKTAVPTADQAGQKKPDIDVAQQIRKAITGDSALSTNAHNCKVVVNNGVVTLAGPVASTDERTRVEAIATGIAGSANVVDQLAVAN